MKCLRLLPALIGVVASAVLPGCKPGTEPEKAHPVDIAALTARADAGDAHAQAELGGLYASGQGVTNNYAEAAKWYRKAADQGEPAGELGLGELYEAGQGVPQDLSQAIVLYRAAAEHGYPRAQYTMGFMYEAGRGVPQNHTEAAKWFLRAAEQGDRLAQYDIGQRYELGLGVSADKIEALKWFILAANQRQPDAALRRDRLKRELTRAQIAEAERRAAAVAGSRQR